MTTATRAERHPWVLLFVAVCLVAANLRMTITGVGPLLDQIAEDQRVSPAALGALASVPLLAWGLFSPLAQGISARVGLSRAISWALLVLALGTVWRSLPGSIPPTEIPGLLEALEKDGIRQKTEAKMSELYDDTFALLNTAGCSQDTLAPLRELFTKLIRRAQ